MRDTIRRFKKAGVEYPPTDCSVSEFVMDRIPDNIPEGPFLTSGSPYMRYPKGTVSLDCMESVTKGSLIVHNNLPCYTLKENNRYLLFTDDVDIYRRECIILGIRPNLRWNQNAYTLMLRDIVTGGIPRLEIEANTKGEEADGYYAKCLLT